MPIDERFLKKRHTTEGCLGLNNAQAEAQANVWAGLTLDQRDSHQVHTVQQANFQRKVFDKEHDYYVKKKRTIDHADPTASWCTKASVGFNFGAPSRRDMSGEWRGKQMAVRTYSMAELSQNFKQGHFGKGTTRLNHHPHARNSNDAYVKSAVGGNQKFMHSGPRLHMAVRSDEFRRPVDYDNGDEFGAARLNRQLDKWQSRLRHGVV